MVQEIGESRDAWGSKVWQMAEDFANNMKKEVKPFYIVYAAKYDPYRSEVTGKGVYNQTMKAYYQRPAPMLGILTWYVDNAQGIFQFIPELSAPPDVPLDPRLLSTDSDDSSARVAQQGQKLHAIVS
jgi:hypothetical protein